MSTPFVAILMGSDSDFPVMQTTLDVLKSFGISYEVKLLQLTALLLLLMLT